jgi:hypothetical protein
MADGGKGTEVEAEADVDFFLFVFCWAGEHGKWRRSYWVLVGPHVSSWFVRVGFPRLL